VAFNCYIFRQGSGEMTRLAPHCEKVRWWATRQTTPKGSVVSRNML